LKKLQTKMNLALTGTPIENSLGELKSLFDIVLPKYLPVDAEFREKFVIPIEKDRNIEANKLLAALIKPFVLRRKKTEVLDDLPEKIEEISISELLPKQRELYNQVATRSDELLKDENEKSFHMHVFALLNKLKQVCNHPALYHGDVENYEEYKSGKWDLFVELLEESRRSKQKVVVFTQYLGMMDIMEKYLKDQGIKYSAIRGSTSNRREQVTRFQNDPEYEVFVGSLNAAGVGIDLTSASVVIHYDRWWNPARENQATDRVHRMGQSRGVSVFKFVTKHSLEEHIHHIIEKKSKLIENIVGYDSEDDFKKLGKAELKKILHQIQNDL
ncbi:DEAD/DEAH box helicase, partial [bacterium]|nr:DEAD/DEAH box helicase [bacterium]